MLISVIVVINIIDSVNVCRFGILVFCLRKNVVVVIVSVERVMLRLWFICIKMVFSVFVFCILLGGMLVKVMVFISVKCIEWVILLINKIMVIVNDDVEWFIIVSVIKLRVMSMLFIISMCLKLKVFMIYVVVGFIVKFLVNSYSNSELVFIGE